MIELTVDGIKVLAEEGMSLLEVVRGAGFEVPTLCNHPAVEPYGACRLCQLQVSRGNWSRLVASCIFPAQDGLVVSTRSEEVVRARRMLLGLLWSRCPSSTVIGDLARSYGLQRPPFPARDEACILCGLCVRFCRERVGAEAIGFQGRGPERRVGTPFDLPSEPCYSCRACAGICPIGTIHYEEVPGREAVRWYTAYEGDQQPLPRARVDTATCSGAGCAACLTVCPVGCIRLVAAPEKGEAQTVALVDRDACVGCRYCEKICLKNAMQMEPAQENPVTRATVKESIDG
ncbi:MAG: (2Fe-2S)-binding protein [Candidatus Wallbacteria bacterium]|nr:(2Fe-2S)-binding protein [Candidatus Wallbacteria bacterium]